MNSMSRVDVASLYTVQKNAKIFDFGEVYPRHRPILSQLFHSYWLGIDEAIPRSINPDLGTSNQSYASQLGESDRYHSPASNMNAYGANQNQSLAAMPYQQSRPVWTPVISPYSAEHFQRLETSITELARQLEPDHEKEGDEHLYGDDENEYDNEGKNNNGH